ncbi:retrovirus-related pol polyprotein from transposon TNT 1-94 [Tanacetum coccineum]
MKAKAKPFPPCTHCGFNDHRPDDCRMYPECKICGSNDHATSGHNHVIIFRGGVLAESSQSSKSLVGSYIMEPIWYLESGCSRSMTGVMSYLQKYVEQPGPKVVFGNNSSGITEGYGLINYGGIVFSKFDDKQGTTFNANKEIVLIAPRRNDVYVLNMSSLTPNGACFFAKASESVDCLWHKRLLHLNFKNIIKLIKQNKVLGLPLLVYSKDKPCSPCEEGKHHRASFKTNQNFSIRKCLYLLHMDLFGPVSPMSINHEKYTLVIVNEYSRYTQVHFLKKKSQAADVIISFIRMVENKNNVKVKQIRTDNGTEFRNYYLEIFCPNSSLKFKGTLRLSPAEEKPVLILKSNLNHKLKHVIINNVKICLGIDLEPDELIKDSGYTKHMAGNKNLFSYNGVEEEAIEVSDKKNLRNDIEDETLDIDEIVNIKESKNHPLDNVIGNLNKRTLRSQAQDKSNFFCFISTIETKIVSEALKDKSWVVAMQEELNQFTANNV